MGSSDARGGDSRRSNGERGTRDGEIVAFPGMMFPGVGRIDELVPMGAAADAPVITRSGDGDDREGEADVLVFPGVGRVDELVPMDSGAMDSPAALAPDAAWDHRPDSVAPAITADSFWGEDSPALHQPIAAPSGSSGRPAVAEPVAARPRGGGPLLVAIALMFLCLVAGLAFAVHEAGRSSRPSAVTSVVVGRHGAKAATHTGGDQHGRHAPTHASVEPRAVFGPVRVPRTTVVRRPATRRRAASTQTVSPTRSAPVQQSEPVSEPSDTEDSAAPVQTTPTPAPVTPEPAQSEPAQSEPAQSEPELSGSTPASTASTDSSGSRDIGAGSGLPGPGGPPAP